MSLLLLILLVLALTITQALAGGRQIVLCLPGYALLVIAALLSFWPRRRNPIPRAATECLVAALLFFSYVSIRAVFSPEAYLARADLYTAMAGMTAYLLIALNLTSSRWRLLLVGAILTLAMANCAIGAIQFFKGQDFMPFPFLPRIINYGARASGFYSYPNHLSGFLEIALMLGLGITFWSRCSAWVKILAGYVCVMVLLGILITGSRGGYISGAVGLLTFVLLSLVLIGKLGSGRLVGLLFAGLLVLGVGYGVKQVMSKSALLQTRAEETLTVDASRMRLWQAAWKQFRLSPVVGTGSGTYLYYGRQFRNPAVHTDPVHAHNDYFELLGEYGIIGIICAVIFLETHLRRGWNSVTERIENSGHFQGIGSNSMALTVGALSAAAATLTHCLLDFNLHIPANVLTAAVVFGLLSTPGDGPDAVHEDEEPGWPPFLRLALPALGVLMIVRILPTARGEYYAERTRYILADWHRTLSPELNQEMEGLARLGLTWDPQNPDLYAAIAEAQSTQGDLATEGPARDKFYNETVENYRKALELAPRNVGYMLGLISALDMAGRYAEADPLAERALELDPSGGGTRTVIANLLFSEHKYDESEAQYKQGIRFGSWQAGEAGVKNIEQLRKEGKIPPPSAPTASPGSSPSPANPK